MILRPRTLALTLALVAGSSLGAQVRSTARPADSASVVEAPREVARRAQARFETYRRANLPRTSNGGGNTCQERVGRFCYWYDEESPPPPPEAAGVTAMRDQLRATLDSLARTDPTDAWIAGQRVRYHDEAGRADSALRAATECRAADAWCTALRGFALHQLGRYADAEAAFDSTIVLMREVDRCQWTDISLYLDDDARRQYQRNACGTPQRAAFEARVWYLARTRYALRGNDSRTEHFARLTYTEFLRAAPSAYMFGFDEDERELVLRFGWARSWSRGPDLPIPQGSGGGPNFSIVGHDPIPAYRYIPPNHVLISPTVSDSVDWAVQLPPVVARYQPVHARRLLMLEHQNGLFRRGDTALVVLAYDVSRLPQFVGAEVEASLTLTPGGVPRAFARVVPGAPTRGTIVVRAPWAPLLMSAEVAAPDSSVLARARYGIAPPLAQGVRVSLSTLLFFAPFDSLPTAIEEALPHALATQKVRASQKLGVFWEAYNTNPAGEVMTISLTVVPETEEAGGLRRAARALRLARESAPVSVSIQDVSTRGATRTGRAVTLDISTLRRGDYLVQLEIAVAGQYTIRTDRRLTVTGP